MLSWFQALMPREDRFFDLFARHADVLVLGAHSLRKLLDGGADVPKYCAEVAAYEQQCDDITRDVLLAARRSFITPFDRSDIKDLITSMDDAIDQMKQTSKAIILYELRDFEPQMREISDIIIKGCEITVKTIPALKALRSEFGSLHQLTEEITRIEDISDQLHDQGLRILFQRHRHNDPMAYIVGSEIYGHLERVMDRLEDVANTINGIVLEHA